jgi:hypothetical protein
MSTVVRPSLDDKIGPIVEPHVESLRTIYSCMLTSAYRAHSFKIAYHVCCICLIVVVLENYSIIHTWLMTRFIILWIIWMNRMRLIRRNHKRSFNVQLKRFRIAHSNVSYNALLMHLPHPQHSAIQLLHDQIKHTF